MQSKMKIYTEQYHLQLKSLAKISLVIFLAIFMSYAILIAGKLSLVLVGVVLWGWLLFFKTHIALMVAVFVWMEGFGFINIEYFLRIPGVFKLQDLLFVSLFLPKLVSILTKKDSGIKADNIIKLPLLVLLLSVIALMVRTVYIHDISWISVLKAGRHYLFYAVFFFVIWYVNTKEKLQTCLKIIICFAVLLSLIHIFQISLGSEHKIFISARVIEQVDIARVYLKGGAVRSIVFIIVIWNIFLVQPMKRWWIIVAAITGLSWVLSLSRAGWLWMLIAVFAPFIIMWPTIKKSSSFKQVRNKIKFAVVIFVILGFIFILAAEANIGEASFFMKRIKSTIYDFTNMSGTFGYRIEESQFRFAAIKKYFVLGPGFIHPDIAAERFIPLVKPSFNPYARSLTTVDSGITTLLVNFGIYGIFLFGWFSIRIIKFCRNTSINMKDTIFQGFPIGFSGYLIGGIDSFITLGIFTMPQDIVVLGATLGLIQVIDKIYDGKRNIFSR